MLLQQKPIWIQNEANTAPVIFLLVPEYSNVELVFMLQKKSVYLVLVGSEVAEWMLLEKFGVQVLSFTLSKQSLK